MPELELDDYEECISCGHLGIYHLRKSADELEAGCVIQVKFDSIYSRRCKCLIRRKEKNNENQLGT